MATTKPVAALNVYKKVAIIRRSTDVLTYEDAEGKSKTVTDLHLAAVETVSSPSGKNLIQDETIRFLTLFLLDPSN